MTNPSDMTGGLPPELDYMFPGRPQDPEMRESTSFWLFEENGAFAFPRNGIEAQGAVWDRHRYDCNFAFPDGRVLRESTRADTIPSIGGNGRADVLGVGPLSFTCIEPFRKWRVAYEGEVYAGSVGQQIDRSFGIYADGGPYDHPRIPVAYEVELTMAAPAWVQDYRQEMLEGMTEQQRTDAGLMGYGYRIEQLFRGSGSLRIDGTTREFTSVGSRIHRQSVRPLAAFRGHCWQSCLFPDGRAFGYIAYPLREGETEADRYNIGYIVQDGRMYPAKARNIPFLRTIKPRGDDVSLELESEVGITRIAGTTELSTFHLGNAGMNGFHNQQGGVRYALDGMEAFGMIERSSPAELCTIAS
ncbi:hypothetical protein [Novosphingobium sp. P6W]|uniref:hypothetical protein n=1 Tax=Novosphingobium sp. P6W TaxID=1609758 RepID=UPI0005C2C48C|nr:hypothetical protein [Novosphingobium sp. P6W]AXB75550.1 hypothetical protein TQ38_002685 [Novosphingobium sp. P6W]KIS30219.1 hypothetical protein TQ38_23980 [Novosphingobium sp. P6W]